MDIISEIDRNLDIIVKKSNLYKFDLIITLSSLFCFCFLKVFF